MRAFVTGGTGFVGSFLIEQLRARGDEVRALVRPGSDAEAIEATGAEVVRGDLDSPDSLVAGCLGRDVVYHAAARVEMVGSQADFDRTTVGGTQRLVEAARQADVRRFVYISSCGVYHPRLLASGQVIDESTPTPEPPRWFRYARAKLRAEEVTRRECRDHLEWVIVRLGYLYGPRNRAMRLYLEPAFRERIMTIVGDGENEMAMVYVEDAVRAVVLAGDCPAAAGRILIAGGNERVTQRDYFNALAEGFGLPPLKQSVPYWIAFLFGWLSEYIGVGMRRRLVRRSAVALTGLPQRICCDRTCALLEWKPCVRFADGMRRAFEWYAAEQVHEAAVPPTSARRDGASP